MLSSSGPLIQGVTPNIFAMSGKRLTNTKSRCLLSCADLLHNRTIPQLHIPIPSVSHYTSPRNRPQYHTSMSQNTSLTNSIPPLPSQNTSLEKSDPPSTSAAPSKPSTSLIRMNWTVKGKEGTRDYPLGPSQWFMVSRDNEVYATQGSGPVTFDAAWNPLPKHYLWGVPQSTKFSLHVDGKLEKTFIGPFAVVSKNGSVVSQEGHPPINTDGSHPSILPPEQSAEEKAFSEWLNNRER